MSQRIRSRVTPRHTGDKLYCNRWRSALTLGVLMLILAGGNTLYAQTPFLGQVKVFAGTFAPRGWAECNGQLLQISQHQALFALLGTTYGGDGRTTFALPDLRSRVVPGRGQGPGLANYPIGSTGGQEAVQLTPAQMPAHSHGVRATSSLGATDVPKHGVPSRAPDASGHYSTTGGSTMNANAVSSTGGNAAHNNISPNLTLRYIIAIEGIFPSRN